MKKYKCNMYELYYYIKKQTYKPLELKEEKRCKLKASKAYLIK
jgi:hypothetical protein